MKKLLCMAAMMLMAMMMLTGCGKKKVDVSSLVDVEYSGFDGQAKVSFVVNEKYLKDRDVTEKLFPDLTRNEAKEELTKLFKELTIEADKTTGLKNGDTIEIVVSCEDSEVLEDNKLALENTKFTVEVKKLKEGTMVDPFAGVEVTFNGYDGSGDYSIDRTKVDNIIRNNGSFSFDYEVAGKLKNGDKFKVTYILYSEENFFEQGYAVTATEKEYTVSGLEAIKDVDPFDYIEISYQGYTGEAYASIKRKDGFPDALWYGDFTLSKNSEISIDDEIEVTYSYSADMKFERYGIRISNTKKTFKASVEDGIKEYTEIDVFPDNLITFSGISPVLTAKVDKSVLDSAISSYVSYSFEGGETYGNYVYYKNGDEITLKLGNVDNLKRRGYVAKATERTYKVPDQESYYKAGDVIDDVIADSKNYAIEAINLKALNSYLYAWDDTLTELSSIKLVSYEMYVNNDISRGLSSSYPYNLFMAIYEVKGTFKNAEKSHYIAVLWGGVSQDKEGVINAVKDSYRFASNKDDLSLSTIYYMDRFDKIDVTYNAVEEPTEVETEEETTEASSEEETQDEESTEEASEEASEEATEETVEESTEASAE